MPDLDLDQGADSQDGAETFDETHRDALEAGAVDFDDDPDLADDVYDVTTAIGDEDLDDDEEIYAVLADPEDRSFGHDGRAPNGGSGATAEDVEDESDPQDELRLDEGLEETFPASDPVSANHIT